MGTALLGKEGRIALRRHTPDAAGKDKASIVRRKLEAIGPQVAEAERQLRLFKEYLENRVRSAQNGGIQYPDSARASDGRILLKREGTLSALVEERDRLEEKLKRLSVREMEPVFKEACATTRRVSTIAKPHVVAVIELTAQIHRHLQELARLAQLHERASGQAARMRNQLMQIDPEFEPGVVIVDLPVSFDDLQRRMRKRFDHFNNDDPDLVLECEDYGLDGIAPAILVDDDDDDDDDDNE